MRRFCGRRSALDMVLSAGFVPGAVFVDLEVQVSWQVQYFVGLEVQISWQVYHFVDLEVQISWQAQYFVDIYFQACKPHPPPPPIITTATTNTISTFITVVVTLDPNASRSLDFLLLHL